MTPATRTLSVPLFGLDFEVLADDTEIAPAIERGAWEAHETRLFRAHVERGSRVLDLGGNVGWYAVLGVHCGAEVTVFEPVPAIADVLERNVERANQLGPGHARVIRAAAGSARGSATIALNARANPGDNRVFEGSAPPADMGASETLEIAVERVDDHVQGPIDMLKVDTQGSEWHALQGAQVLLEKSPSLALLIEFWPYALRGATDEQLLAFLVERGFTLGKATEAPYPMAPARILAQARARDPVKGGLDLYGTRGRPFHVLGAKARLHGLWRSIRER